MATLKYKIEPPCWDARAKGYLVHVLVSPNTESGTEMWQSWCKDLADIVPGIGRSKREAIDSVKEHIRSYLTTLLGGHENVKIPWTSITAIRSFGSSVVLALIDNCPNPSGKFVEEEVAAVVEVQSPPADKKMVKPKRKATS